MKWTVKEKRSLSKKVRRLPRKIQNILVALKMDIMANGPVRGNWPNYGKLSGTRHHCHLKKGTPTYVAVWEVVNQEVKFIEVIYAGTHEKAPY
ncbi:cytotoxic translational repressor of toxin-antitoxin stability system [bacterium]|nr:cytotoxic translational repressor of toxin-antitoxin stability system [bacterium]